MPIVLKMIEFIHKKCFAPTTLCSLRTNTEEIGDNYLIHVTSNIILLFQISNLVDQMRPKKINRLANTEQNFPFLRL